MTRIQECEDCGSKAEFDIRGSTQGLFCSKCDWAVLRTYIPQIDLDRTTYKLFIISGDHKNKNQVKTIARVANVNFLQARQMLLGSDEQITEGSAVAIDNARQDLSDVGLEFYTEPDFPH